MPTQFVSSGNLALLFVPVISSGIGWLTNYLAVKMLFHPRKELHFIFFRVQGVFPRRKQALAEKLGDLVARELFSTEDVAEKIKSGVHSPRVEAVLKNGIHKFINEKLPKKVPILAMMLKPEFSQKIEEVLLESIMPLVDEVIDSVSEELHDTLDIRQTVEDKVAVFSSEKLEEMLFSIMKKEFRFIEILGGVLGFIIGCVQLLLLRFI